MESWRKVWREGLAPHISIEGLERLRAALIEDDERLIQGATTSPPPLQCVQDWPAEKACALGFCELIEGATVAQVEEFLAQTCFMAGQDLGEEAACRYFLNWYDDTPREEMRKELLPEVDLALTQKHLARPSVRLRNGLPLQLEKGA